MDAALRPLVRHARPAPRLWRAQLALSLGARRRRGLYLGSKWFGALFVMKSGSFQVLQGLNALLLDTF